MPILILFCPEKSAEVPDPADSPLAQPTQPDNFYEGRVVRPLQNRGRHLKTTSRRAWFFWSKFGFCLHPEPTFQTIEFHFRKKTSLRSLLYSKSLYRQHKFLHFTNGGSMGEISLSKIEGMIWQNFTMLRPGI